MDNEENKSTASAMAIGKSYPEPDVEYQQLVDDPSLFLEKLRNFHSSSDPHFTSPSVGGTTLDLHRLFVEVTSRGGLDQVIRDRKWEDLISAFKLEVPGVRGSFLLRKYYVSLLYHFEQTYFLRKQVAPTVNQLPSVGPTVESTKSTDEESTTTIPSQANLRVEPGISLVGVIDEKFDNGYVVSVNIDSDKLKGILYHIPDGQQTSGNPVPDMPQRRKRKKSRLSLLDPTEVKSSRSGYNFFIEHYGPVQPLSQGQEDWEQLK